VLKAGEEISPVFESPLALFDPEINGAMIEDKYGIPRRRLSGLISPWCRKRLDEFGGDISRFKVVRLMPSRVHQIGIAKTEPGDENNQDISSLVGKVDHPQAGDALPERSRRLQLFGRPEPREPGILEFRRDVQGADQDAPSVADGDAGKQLCRHREYRRDPLHRHRHGP
jgi:predicted Ser/Thr protein kinase